jgi:hypothetical protein
MNKAKSITKLAGLALVVAAIALVAVIFFGEGYSLLYFNTETDLPDPMLYQLQPENATGPPIHIIDVNKTYDIIFTVASLEKRKTNYAYAIESVFYNETGHLTLSPKTNKTFHLRVTSQDSEKWILNSTSITESEDAIDITKYSWLAERKDFDILVRNEGLPAIVEEMYNLPISNTLSHFGRIYHVNMTLDELRKKPFEKNSEWEIALDYEKVKAFDEVSLAVKDDKLIVRVRSTRVQYISEERPFVVTLTKQGALKDVQLDEETGLERIQRIKFWYKLR